MIEVWEISLLLLIPRVYSNSDSLGYRAYQHQHLRGTMTVTAFDGAEPYIEITNLTNLTHRIKGKPVTYVCNVDNVRWHGIGSNKSGIFKTRSVTFSLVAEPSYAIGEEPTEDNALYVTVSGRGNEIRVAGNVAGNLGCGCKEYGHVSPTRIWGQDTVVDVAATFGTWKAKRKEVDSVRSPAL